MNRTLVSFTDNRTIEEARAIYEQRLSDAREVFQRFSEQFQIRNCPFCGSSTHEDEAPFLDLYGVVRCRGCQSRYINPCPSEEALGYYYNHCRCNGMLQAIYRKRGSKKEDVQVDQRALVVGDMIREHFSDRTTLSILEVGCGVGATLKKVKTYLGETFSDRVFKFTGIDIDKDAVSNPVDGSLNLINCSAEALRQSRGESFDIIMHFELIEHLPDPHGFMLDLHRLCRKGGVVYFTTPNDNGLEMKVGYKEFRPLAHALYPPMHLNAFSTTNALHFLKRSHFDLLRLWTPGKLDLPMIGVSEPQDPLLKDLCSLDKDSLALIQELVSELKASGHMAILAEASH